MSQLLPAEHAPAGRGVLADASLISADSHIVEPADVWERHPLYARSELAGLA